MSAQPRVSVLSVRRLARHPSRCYGFEFEDIASDLLDATLIAPEFVERTPRIGARKLQRLVRRLTGLVPEDHDLVGQTRVPQQELFLMMCVTTGDLGILRNVKGWRENSRIAICWIQELFANSLAETPHLDLLNQFDLVVVNCAHSLEPLTRWCGTKVHCLPLGIDAITFCPYPNPPVQGIDIFWMGRRLAREHHALYAAAEAARLLYMFATTAPDNVPNLDEHRRQLVRRIQCSKLFVVAPARWNESEVTAGQQEVGFRYYEGAAAGAAMIGHVPNTPTFGECFFWPDAVIELPPDTDDYPAFLAEVLAQRQRLARIRRDSVYHSLLRHDWAFRIEALLGLVGAEGLGDTQAMTLRKQELHRLAASCAEGAATRRSG
jgi:Glycosyl transferases group 1